MSAAWQKPRRAWESPSPPSRRPWPISKSRSAFACSIAALAARGGEPWILAPPNTAVRDLVAGAFRARGLEPPRLGVTTYSMQLRLQLLASGRYLTAFPESLLRYNADRWAIKALPVRLGPP